jgi:murein L,D-transpeptidase YcbB/YkuD
MADPTPVQVSLERPLPVLIAYVTALVKGGRLHLFDDLYGHDRELAAALRQRPRTGPDLPPEPPPPAAPRMRP